MSETNSKTNIEYDFDLDIIKEEIKLEPFFDDMKSKFGDNILYNTEENHNFNEINANISQNFGWNTKDEIAVIESSAHEVDKIKVETTDTINPFDVDLDIVKEETKLEPYLDNIKSEFGNVMLYNTEQKHILNETNVNISQNFGGNTAEESAIIVSSAHETDKIKIDTADTVHPFEEEKLFACSLCEYKAVTKTHMIIHTGEKPFACNLCEYRSVTQSHIKRHMSKHTIEKPFTCNLCEYRGVLKIHLKTHMIIHTGEKPFACNLCEYRSANQGHLKRHMSKHTGEKPFACNLCKYRSVNKSELKLHRRKHTGEKPFTCNLCEYKSTNKAHLKTHISIHTGEKPFACNLCEYRSVTQSHIKRHNMSKHKGEKPFACNLCEYRSATKRSLKNHMKIHGNEK